MAINAFLYIDDKAYNVLKFDYTLSYETKESTENKEKESLEPVQKNTIDESAKEANQTAEKEQPAVEKEQPAAEKEQPAAEKSNSDQYYPQGKLKGGFINFHILAQPTDVTVFHEWLLDPDDKNRKDGCFCFKPDGAHSLEKYISFSNAYCVSLQETFNSQTQEQMLLKIKILALCIDFGILKDIIFIHEKADKDKSVLQEAVGKPSGKARDIAYRRQQESL